MTVISMAVKPDFKYIVSKIQSDLAKGSKAEEIMDPWVYWLLNEKVKQDVFLNNGEHNVLTYSQSQVVIGNAILKARKNLCQ